MNRLTIGLLVLACTIAVQASVLRNGFVFFDDDRFVTNNHHIDSLEDPARFFTDPDTAEAGSSLDKDIYRPLRTLTFAAITAAAGSKQSARPFHALSLLLHGVAAWLLYRLLLHAGLGPWAAAFGALLFGVHPATVETTAWVCSLGDLQCGVFVLLSMLAFAGAVPGPGRTIGALCALAGALLAKEHAVIVPLLWLGWDLCFRRELWRRHALRVVLPGLVVVLLFLGWRQHLGIGLAQTPEPLGGSHLRAVATMTAGMGWYAGGILLPYGSTFQARVDGHSVPAIALGVLVLAALAAALFSRRPHVRAAAGWFLIALIPVSNVLVPLKIPTADRFLYIPLMGLALGAGALVSSRPRLGLPLGLVVLGLFSLLTANRIGDWRDSASLVAAGTRVAPKSTMLIWAEASERGRVATELMEAERFTEAEAAVNESLGLYLTYIRNVAESETFAARMEMGDLLYNWAVWSERLDHRQPAITAYGDSLNAYLAAFRLQRARAARPNDVEMERAADMASRICVRLAEPSNPDLSRTVKLGIEMIKFLEQRGKSLPARYAQLLLVYAGQLRGEQPAKARTGLVEVLRLLDLAEKDGVPVAFLRGQALLYRSILRDRPLPPGPDGKERWQYDRAGLDQAGAYFEQAAKDQPAVRLRAAFMRARVYCVTAKLFNDKKEAARGNDLLNRLPTLAKQFRQKLSRMQLREIESEKGTCVAR